MSGNASDGFGRFAFEKSNELEDPKDSILIEHIEKSRQIKSLFFKPPTD